MAFVFSPVLFRQTEIVIELLDPVVRGFLAELLAELRIFVVGEVDECEEELFVFDVHFFTSHALYPPLRTPG